ncbi:ATP-binding protein [Brevibacillus ruminantium]|uniref:histidine kinase n=1 Tax=Brevibacillus ruminantium TaxID=2950604 RepID=A0ABY4WHB4_9BACL|nr:ATP-binding protein [Brevibacillus ruminantium]USG66546.1 ATP-binding protein [Brevibacillus ruminantium]
MRSLRLQQGIRFGYRAAGLALIPLILFVLLIALYQYTVPDRTAPEARQGVLDLSQWDFGQKSFIALNGEWSFYPNELFRPDDFRNGRTGNASTYSAQIPNAWYSSVPIDKASQTTYGTYRLIVKLPETGGQYGFRVSNIHSSHRLYVNGLLLGNGGNPTTAANHDYQTENKPYSTFAWVQGPEMEIILQVANFTLSNGGGFEDLYFGSQADISRLDQILFAFEFFGLFILLLFGGYHLSIYVMRLKDKAYLYSGLYFLTLMVLVVLDGDKLLLQLVPGISNEFYRKMYNLGGFSNIAVLGIFLHHLDGKLLTRRHLALLLSPITLYLGTVLVLPYEVYSKIGNLPWEYVTLVVAFYLYRAVRLGLKKDGQLKHKESFLVVGMLISVTMILLVGFFYSLGLVQTDMGRRMAFLAVIMFMNALLALRLTSATEQTEKLTEQLLVRDKLKDEFLANTSHELKTPLHGIQNIASYLLDGKAGTLSERQRTELSLIYDTSTKLSALVNDLIDVVRLKHGDLLLGQTAVDLRVAAETAFQVLEFELMGKDVRWENRIPPGTMAAADENRVRQVLYNLIHNAMKHTKNGYIEISAVVAESQVAVSVEDTGVGIAPEIHEAIFGYFEQVDQVVPNDGYTGMGFGLYISRKLIERMGGRIFVERSEPGQGTRMTFILPIAQGGTDETAAPSLLSSVAGSRMTSALQMPLDIIDPMRQNTVLVVDDEASNVRILLNLLGDEYNVLTAFSAKEALQKLEAYPRVDLMIVDVMMPEISGIDLCQAVRETRSVLELPVLFATVKDSLYDIELCFRAGGNDFIAKPFDAKTLTARVRTLLSMKTSMDQAMRNEIAFLQAQIKPHFLYNAISSIVSFCYTDGEKAAYLLSMLSRYLRTVFQRELHAPYVPLNVELELIRAYVEIEKARFGDRLSFKLQQDSGLESVVIPSFTIQPFVENAIRHGIFEKEGTGTVALSITDGNGYIRFEIVDDGVGMADDVLYQLNAGERPDGSGIGMTNVRKRLMSLPGASVSIDSALEKGTKVVVYLPKREAANATG